MKKRFLTLLAGVFTLLSVSCSGEDDTAVNEAAGIDRTGFRTKNLTGTELSNAVSLYAGMMATTEYANLKASISAFNTKLNGNNVNFATRAEWVNWIKTNLASTTFASEAEFESMYDDNVSNMAVIIANNDTLFRRLASATQAQIEIITAPEYGAEPGTGGPAPSDSCQEDCMDLADASYAATAAAFAANVDGLDVSEIYDASIYLIAVRIRDWNDEATTQQYINCYGSCGAEILI